MKNKKSIIFVNILIIVSIILATGCGNTKEASGKYTSKEIYDKVTAAITDMPEMTVVNDGTDEGWDAISYVTDFKQDKIKDFVFSYSSEGLADEIVIIRLNSSEDVTAVKEDLEERLETRKNTFSIYNTEEGGKFQGATVVDNGNYLMLIIGKQAQNGKFAFNEVFED